MNKPPARRASSGKGLVCGIGIYEPQLLCMTDALHLPKVYRVWSDMLTRTTAKYTKQRPSYAGTSVAKEFHRFLDFAEWMTRQTSWSKDNYQLDKDLLIKGNRIYSPDTCVFLPPAINSLLLTRANGRGDLPIGVTKGRGGHGYVARIRIGGERAMLGVFDDPGRAFLAYKEAKEVNIKWVAEQYRDEIDPRAYAALLAYQVEITD